MSVSRDEPSPPPSHRPLSVLGPALLLVSFACAPAPDETGAVNAGGTAGLTTATGASASTSDGGTPAAGGTGGETLSTGGATSSGGSAMVGTTGVQADPGTEGDGTYDQPAPYETPNETLYRSPDVPVGVLSGEQFYDSPSVYPDLTFRYWTYVPAQYEPGKPAALMVFQDGSHYVGETEAKFNSSTVFDNLIHEGSMPVTIGLFIDPGSQSESGVYQYPGEQGIRSMQYDTPSETFSEFLLTEAIPDLILSQYDIVDDPEGWAIGGHSSGGICALMAAWYNPDEFRKVLTHNASFPQTSGVFPQEIADTTPNKPLRIYMLSGTNDIRGTDPGGWFDLNNEAAEILEAKGYHYRYLSGTGIHYPPEQGLDDYPDALRWLWRGYSIPHYD